MSSLSACNHKNSTDLTTYTAPHCSGLVDICSEILFILPHNNFQIYSIAIQGRRPGPIFTDVFGEPSLMLAFIAEICRILVILGIPQDQYAGHSFRIGAATSAALTGIADSMSQLLSRWQSAAFLCYVKTPPAQLAWLSIVLAASSTQISDSQIQLHIGDQ